MDIFYLVSTIIVLIVILVQHLRLKRHYEVVHYENLLLIIIELLIPVINILLGLALVVDMNNFIKED